MLRLSCIDEGTCLRTSWPQDHLRGSKALGRSTLRVSTPMALPSSFHPTSGEASAPACAPAWASPTSEGARLHMITFPPRFWHLPLEQFGKNSKTDSWATCTFRSWSIGALPKTLSVYFQVRSSPRSQDHMRCVTTMVWDIPDVVLSICTQCLSPRLMSPK